jgi:predicted nucleic acid-binding protein
MNLAVAGAGPICYLALIDAIGLLSRLFDRVIIPRAAYVELTHPHAPAVKLTVLHEIDKTGSKFIESVSGDRPHILAILKSLLETGKSLEATRHWPQGGCSSNRQMSEETKPDQRRL